MLHDLGWRSLEQRRLDARLIMFYKIVYGLVAIQLPSYLEQPMKITRHMHSLSYRQIHTAANYYQFPFFPMPIVLWNRLPALILTPLNRQSVRSHTPSNNWLVVLRLNVPVNNFSVMSGRSHRFLGN